MLPTEVMRQIRRLQLRARLAVQTLLGGEYHSVFKGTGLSFEEVREYQPGDDVRTIDWNVTARVGSPFIKCFVEERELTVLLLVDVSGSQRFGSQRVTKRTVAAELAALIAFSAIANNDRVGLIACTDIVERDVPPSKGSKHVLRLLRDILFFEPKNRGTSLKVGLDYLNQVQTRRVIVFLMSDFADEGFESAFRLASRKHDLIVVQTGDPRTGVTRCRADLFRGCGDGQTAPGSTAAADTCARLLPGRPGAGAKPLRSWPARPRSM